MSEKPRYRFVRTFRGETQDFEAKINALAEEGYIYRTLKVCSGEEGNYHAPECFMIMELEQETKYENIEQFMKAEISVVPKLVPDGWEVIHHTSKEMILVKKHDKPSDREAHEPIPA